MIRTKKIIIIVLAVLFIVGCCVLVACDDNSTDDDKQHKTEWYYSWDVVDVGKDSAIVLLPWEPYLIVCNYRCAQVNNGSNFELNSFTRSLKFTLVLNDGTVLYDNQAVEISCLNDIEVNLDAPLSSRFIPFNTSVLSSGGNGKWYSQNDESFMICFCPKHDGTLYIDFALESSAYRNICLSAGQDCYVVGDISNKTVNVAVNNVSVGYISNDKYNNGSFDDGDLRSEPDFTRGNAYMVLDFEFNSIEDNDGSASIKTTVSVFATALKTTISEAPTGEIEELAENGITKMCANFKVPHKASENKSVRLIVQLTPIENKNDIFTAFSVDVLFAGIENARVTDGGYDSYTYVVGKEELLIFEPTINGYEVIGILNEKATVVVVPQRYNGCDVVEISYGAFENCTEIESITLPFIYRGGLFYREHTSFYGIFGGIVPASCKNVELSDSVTSIPESVFYECVNIENVIIPRSVTSIGAYAFYGCVKLATITIPDSVTEIGDKAFWGCRGTQIYCESTPEKINRGTDWCGSVNTYPERMVIWNCRNNSVAHDHKEYAYIDGIRYIVYPGYSSYGKDSAIVTNQPKNLVVADIPSKINYEGRELTVVEIADGGFSYCSSLISIEIPSSVTSIIGAPFEFCDSLAEITVDDGNPVYYSVDNCVIETESKMLVAGCKNSVIPTDGSVVSIGYHAFYECRDLTSIVIPVSVISIENEAFWAVNDSYARYNSLVSITYTGTMEQWYNVEKGDLYYNVPNDLKIYCTDGIIKLDKNGYWFSE